MSSRSIKNNNSQLLNSFCIANCYHSIILITQKQTKTRGQALPTNRLFNLLGGHSPGEVGISHHLMDMASEYY